MNNFKCFVIQCTCFQAKKETQSRRDMKDTTYIIVWDVFFPDIIYYCERISFIHLHSSLVFGTVKIRAWRGGGIIMNWDAFF